MDHNEAAQALALLEIIALRLKLVEEHLAALLEYSKPRAVNSTPPSIDTEYREDMARAFSDLMWIDRIAGGE